MTANRRNALLIRWAIVSATMMALFWGVWYLIAGAVPVVTEIPLIEKENILLPFGISRWWDVLLAPVWTSIILMLLNMSWQRWFDDDGLVVGLVGGLVVGLGVGLAYGLVVGLVGGLVYGLGVATAGIVGAFIGGGIANMCAIRFWKGVGRFLTAQDKE